MTRYITRNLWIGIGVFMIAVVYFLEAGKIRTSALDDPVGASGLPKALAMALGVLAILLIIRDITGAILSARRDLPVEEKDTETSFAEIMKPHMRAIGMFAIGIGYLLVISTLGYAVSVGLLLLGVSLYIGAPMGLKTLAVAVIGGVFYHLLFVEFLGIRLPQGVLLGMFGG